MSTYWGYRCEPCDTQSERGYNHGDDMLLAVLRAYSQIKALKKAIEGTAAAGYLEIGLMGDYDEVFQFLLDHGDHGLVLISEYGKKLSLENSEG